jgi:hypothetical protein
MAELLKLDSEPDGCVMAGLALSELKLVIYLPICDALTEMSNLFVPRIEGGRLGVSANFRAVSVAKFCNRTSGSVPIN